MASSGLKAHSCCSFPSRIRQSGMRLHIIKSNYPTAARKAEKISLGRRTDYITLKI